MTTYDFIAANKRKSVLLIFVFSLLVVALGALIDYLYNGGGTFIIFAVLYSIITSLVGYYSGDRIALATSGAQEISATDNPRLYRLVENLCITVGLPMPKVHLINDPAINAFATGRDPNHSSMAVTTGALEQLSDRELEGVLAHELSHIRNYDIRFMMLVMILVGTVVIISDMAVRSFLWGGRRRDRDEKDGGGILLIIGLVLIILAPIIAQLIKLAVSRRREYLADASGALITRFPEGLADALKKISEQAAPMQQPSSATAHLFIANPFSGKAWANLFSTHPPIEKRITALRQMNGANT